MSRGKNFLFLSYFFEVKIWFVTRNAHPKTAPLTQIHTRGIREQHTHTYAPPPLQSHTSCIAPGLRNNVDRTLRYDDDTNQKLYAV